MAMLTHAVVLMCVCADSQRSRALQGDYRAARALLLPMYEPMITLLTVSLSIEYFFLYLQHSEEASVMLITVLCQWSLNIFTQIGLVLFFCSHSLSHPALLRSLFYAFLLSLVGFICALIDQLWDPLWGQMLFNSLPLPLLIAILSKKIYRRRSVVPYVQFMIVYRAMWVLYTIFTECVESRVAYFICLLAIACLEIPLSIFWFLTMWNDTYFWRTGGLHMEGARNSVWKAVRRVVFGAATSKAVRIRVINTSRPNSPHGGDAAEDGGLSPLMYEHSALHGSEHELSAVQGGGGGGGSNDGGGGGYSLSIDTTTWGLGYEVEALRRIKILQNQDRLFEETQRARMRKKGLQQQQQSSGADGNTAVSSSAGSLQPRSHSPISGHSMSDAFHLNNGSSGPNGLNPALSSSPSGHTLPRAERLLAHSSDLLLSHDVQVLIEANKRRFIDFGLLHINDADCIGRGGSSRVYSGFYRNYPVAIKFFAAESSAAAGGAGAEGRNEELTSDTVKAYAKETAIAAAITHPNVVMFIGICVRPPVIFLVSELCSEGSLFSVLPRIKFHPAWGYHAILSFCIECIRSVLYLHENGFVHRDIKSLNYMVTHRGEVKLTDFGLSRMFPQEAAGVRRTGTPPPTTTKRMQEHANSGTYTPPRSSAASSASASSASASSAAVPMTPSSRSPAIAPHLVSSAHHGLVPAPRPPLGFGAHAAAPSLQAPPAAASAAAAHDLLTRRVGSRCWMSPEMIHGRAYSFSSDIYSLTMVCWEVLTAQAPFDEVPDEDLTAVVMAGHTPAIPPWTPPAFAALLRAGWARDPAARPTARELLDRFEGLQSDLESEFNLERFDCSIFFRPEAPELIYQHQMQLYQQQQMQQQRAGYAQQQPISHVRVAPSADAFTQSQHHNVR